MASPYNIGGNLAFGGGSFCFTNPMGSYQSAYCSALKANQSNYNNIIAGYQGLMGSQVGAQQGITQGYQDLQRNVLGTICGIQQSQMNAIQCQYTKGNAQAQQQAINSGLGNSTVLSSLQRGVCAQKSLATTQVQNQFAQLKAGYMSQLGLACLNYQNQANMQNTALGDQQLQFMGKCVNIPYPNAGMYAAQANANRSMFGSGGGGGGGSSGPMPRNNFGNMTSRAGHLGGNPSYGCGYGGGGGGGYGGFGSSPVYGGSVPYTPPPNGIGSGFYAPPGSFDQGGSPGSFFGSIAQGFAGGCYSGYGGAGGGCFGGYSGGGCY